MLAFALLVSSSYLFKAVAMFLVLVNSWKNIPVTLPYPVVLHLPSQHLYSVVLLGLSFKKKIECKTK